jgi:hypothetical protein
MYSKVVVAASVAKKTCGWSSLAMLCYVVNEQGRLLSLWEVRILQGRIPYPIFKESLNTLLQAAEIHPRGHGICTNLSRQAHFPFPMEYII